MPERAIEYRHRQQQRPGSEVNEDRQAKALKRAGDVVQPPSERSAGSTRTRGYRDRTVGPDRPGFVGRPDPFRRRFHAAGV